MTIEITNSRVIPERNFNQVWVEDAQFIQKKGQDPKYAIKIRYLFYAVDPDGTKVFDENTANTITVEDIEPEAVQAAMEGNMLLLEAMTMFEGSLANIIQHYDENLGPLNVTPKIGT